ncbi:hypothetical protein DCMF_08530 [Candidatus Formimonas warabiya]|uniref:Uncharacterized protein n=1 Tax=Formimonas warabiya TaxID=1761012 RepID=A0A3G1KQT2_FORW1|nr:hypothetical protein DCMF_08530 [Candidatus Formimonas warabiya]
MCQCLHLFQISGTRKLGLCQASGDGGSLSCTYTFNPLKLINSESMKKDAPGRSLASGLPMHP